MPKGGISLLTLQDCIYGLSVLWKETDYNFALWDKCPDIYAEISVEDYLSGFDSVLDKGLQILSSLIEKSHLEMLSNH